jgi:hypothetical protein
MATNRIFYRPAKVNDDGVDLGDDSDWISGPEIVNRPASFTIGSLDNGTEYEFVAGRETSGSFSQSLSPVRRATPLAASVTFDTIGPQTINQGGLTSFNRQAATTTLNMSSANWNFVLLDWVAGPRAGVGRQNKTPPAEYPELVEFIYQGTGQQTVIINLPSSVAFTFRLVSNSQSITITLSSVS